MRFDSEHVIVLLPEFAQGLRQIEQVIAIGAAGAGRAANVLCDFQFAGFAQVCLIVSSSEVSDSGCGRAIVEGHLGSDAQVTVFLTLVELFENRHFDTERQPTADCVWFFDQGDYAPGIFRCTAVIVRTLPETPAPAADSGRFRFLVGKIDQVDQRAIAKQPDFVVIAEQVAISIRFDGVVRHGRILSPVPPLLQCREFAFTQGDVFAKLARALLEFVCAIAFKTVAHPPQFVLQRGQFLPERLFIFHDFDHHELRDSKV